MKCFLNDNGNGNVRLYYVVDGTKIYAEETAGTIDYLNGEVVLTSLNITSVSNVDGVSSKKLE